MSFEYLVIDDNGNGVFEKDLDWTIYDTNDDGIIPDNGRMELAYEGPSLVNPGLPWKLMWVFISSDGKLISVDQRNIYSGFTTDGYGVSTYLGSIGDVGDRPDITIVGTNGYDDDGVTGRFVIN